MQAGRYTSFFPRAVIYVCCGQIHSHCSLPLYLVPLQTLALQCERYQGEKLLSCQQALGELFCVQKSWLDMSLQLFKRHSAPESDLPGGLQVLRELNNVLPELLEQLEMQVSGESGEGHFKKISQTVIFFFFCCMQRFSFLLILLSFLLGYCPG